MKNIVCLILVLSIAATVCATVADFENLTLAPDSHWSGTYPYVDADTDGYPDDTSETVTFQSGNANFVNTSGYSYTYPFWDGFAYSNDTDNTTSGFGNQYSAITGSGKDSDNYAIGFVGWMMPPTITLDSPGIASGAYFTNTTYAYLAMLNGEAPATAFGPDDWFKLTIEGFDAGSNSTGTVDFLLADGTNLIDTWTWVDMSALGVVSSLEFSLTSTDNGDFGMNTPGYFAMDNLTTIIPEPTTVGLLSLGALMIRRKRS